MLTVLTQESLDALAPVRERLLADARREAEQVLTAAREQARTRLDQARGAADVTVEQGRRAGAELAAEAVTRELARARREARGAVLAAQEETRVRVRSAAQAAATAWSTGPDAARVRRALVAEIHAVLGADAVVHGTADGGVTATAGSHRVDLSLTTVVDQVLDERAQEVSRLWS